VHHCKYHAGCVNGADHDQSKHVLSGEELNEDISDGEYEKVIDPFYDNYDSYLEEYVIPEVIAFYIASSFYRNAMWEATFFQHYNSTKDIFNIDETLNTYSHMY
jgi:hypothetical protein